MPISEVARQLQSGTFVAPDVASGESGDLNLGELGARACAKANDWIAERRQFLADNHRAAVRLAMSARARTLLAFSGGLDTSYCVLWLREQGREVHTVTVNTGGFDAAELARIEKLAADLGATSHRTIDAREELFRDYLRFLLFGNVLRGGLYPLSVSAERVCQARRVVAYAQEIGAAALAHGSTGAGNDQVRFDVAFRTLAPELEILAPIRDLAPSRAEERAFLATRGFEFPEKVEQYSINEGMWGTSIGGKETHDPWQHLPDAAYPGGAIDPQLAPRTIDDRFRERRADDV